ncbi:MAG: hypothetical protein QM764_23700 [Chitinophagaceae bacterium]
MGLKSFLKEKGFIEDGPDDKPKAKTVEVQSSNVADTSPVYFPITTATQQTASNSGSGDDPSFVVNSAPQSSGSKIQIDPSFIKFFEDELAKSNLPGPDYFEFRQLLLKTQQKMAAKGNAAPEVVLQAVMMSFEAQDISAAKLVEAAKHYKNVLKQKNDDFLKGAASEKNNQLQKRQSVLQGHTDAIEKIKQQIQQLEQQKKQLEESMNKEKTQQDVDKTLGKEGIEKIERAEKMIALAHDYMQSQIDTDINRLQNV